MACFFLVFFLYLRRVCTRLVVCVRACMRACVRACLCAWGGEVRVKRGGGRGCRVSAKKEKMEKTQEAGRKRSEREQSSQPVLSSSFRW